MGSQRSRGKKGSDIGLHMECYEDELSPAQVAAYSKVKNEFIEFTARIESLIKNNNVDVTEKNDGLVVLQVNSNVAPPPPPLTGLTVNNAAPQVPPGPTPISLTAAAILPPAGSIALQATQPQSGAPVASVPQGSPAYQLVMDPRGFIVGTVAPQASTSLTVPVMAGPVMQQATTQPAPTQTTVPSNKVTVWRPSSRAPVPTPQTTVAGNTVGGANFHITPKVVPGSTPVRAAQPSVIKVAPASAKGHTPVTSSNTANRQKPTPIDSENPQFEQRLLRPGRRRPADRHSQALTRRQEVNENTHHGRQLRSSKRFK